MKPSQITHGTDTGANPARRRRWQVAAWVSAVASVVLVGMQVTPAAASTAGAASRARGQVRAAAPGATLGPGRSLTSGQSLTSGNGEYQLVMQGDGNLVEYVAGRALWTSGTQGHPGARTVMQRDGNLVVYSAGGTALWDSGTQGHAGAQAVLQNDANFVIYSAGGGGLWASNVVNSRLTSGESLTAGQALQSPDRHYELVMQGDGNLVEYVAGRAVWVSGTQGHPGARAVMQGEGNLVIYSATGTALWDSGTQGHSGAQAALQDDANFVIYSSGGAFLWNNGAVNDRLDPGEKLTAGQALQSPDRRYELVMQGDGNLVEYVGGQPLWDSATQGHPGAWAVMQGDGNLVVYSAGGTALWDSGTQGHSGAWAALQNDANFVIYGSGGAFLWNNGAVNSILGQGQALTAGQALQSADRRYELVMQGDGNLVEYVAGRALWDSGTQGHPGARAVMQGDGNLVVYSAGGTALWDSGTQGHPGAQAALQDDANFVVYSGGGTPLWDNNAVNDRLDPGEKLTTGQAVQSPDRRYELVMQGDGNLVEYAGGTALWDSGTQGHPGAWAVMQGDGNLVVYSAGGTALWDSGAQGHPGAWAALQNDANFVVYSAGGTALWANYASSGGTSQAAGIVRAAQSQIGYQDNPAGTFCNQFSAYWGAGDPSSCGNGNNAEQWCADFAAWAWRQAGVSFTYGFGPGDLNASAASFYQWAAAHGTWHWAGSGYTPQPGDAVVYGLDSSGTSAAHVAIVTGYTPGDAGPNVVNGDWWVNGNAAVVAVPDQTTNGAGAGISGYATP